MLTCLTLDPPESVCVFSICLESVCVFSISPPIQDLSDGLDYCDRTLYLYASGFTVLSYIFLFLMLVRGRYLSGWAIHSPGILHHMK